MFLTVSINDQTVLTNFKVYIKVGFLSFEKEKDSFIKNVFKRRSKSFYSFLESWVIACV